MWSSGAFVDGAAGANGASSTARGRVRLRISPRSAIVIVDGVVLPRGTDTIAKPLDEASIHVLVRADKHEDTIVLVDTATPDDVEVTLVPRAASGGGASTGASRPRPPPRDKEKDAGVNAAAGVGIVNAPPNPYE